MYNYSVGKELPSKDPDQPGHQPSKTGFYTLVSMGSSEAQWLSGRVLDSESWGWGLDPHRRHCIVSLSKTLYNLLSTGSTQNDPSRHD